MRSNWGEIARTMGYRSERNMFRTEYSNHHSLNKIAERLGVSRTTVENKMKELGIKRNGRGGPNHKGRIAKLLSGLSLKEILEMSETRMVRERGVRMRQAISYLKRNRML